MLKRHFILILASLFFIFLIYRLIANRVKISNLHYGVKANDIRKKLFVPIIDDYMFVEDPDAKYVGNRWESKKELPENYGEVLHVWKVAIPLTEKAGLSEEKDGFRKKANDSLYYQLNINSTIQGDSFAVRRGELFYYNMHGSPNLNLDDAGIDSVAKKWRLFYLVRK